MNAKGEDAIVLSVRLKSGQFNAEIEVPLSATKEERDQFVEQWLAMLAAGIKVGESNRRDRAE